MKTIAFQVTNPRYQILCLGKKLGWRVRILLPVEVQRATQKRVHTTIVRGNVREATKIAEDLIARYYPPRDTSKSRLYKCRVCLREMSKDVLKGHYACVKLTECADCRDQRKSKRELNQRMRFQVMARDKFTCQYCGRSAPSVELHVDHKIPVSKGGTSELTNLVTACAECNLGKYNLMLDEVA